MGYKVKVQEAKAPRRGTRLSRLWGTGKEGRGEAYVTKASAEKRAKALRREYPAKSGWDVSIVRTRDY